MHPKALHGLEQKSQTTDYRSHKGNKLVASSKVALEAGESEPGENNYLRQDHLSDGDNFDEHIEEMMRVIVAQGKLIYHQLQRFNEKNTPSNKSSKSVPSSTVKVKAQIHSSSCNKMDNNSSTSSNYASTSTSTSFDHNKDDPPKPNHQYSSSKTRMDVNTGNKVDLIRCPENRNITNSPYNPVTTNTVLSPLRSKSKSYDNYETIFPISPLQPSKIGLNTSSDELPTSRIITNYKRNRPAHQNSHDQMSRTQSSTTLRSCETAEFKPNPTSLVMSDIV